MLRSQEITRSIVARDLFWFALGVSAWISLLVFLEAVPKPTAYRSTIRLGIVFGYFVTWILLILHCHLARSRCFWSVFQWCYEGAPPEMEKAWKNMVEEIDFFTRVLSTILLAFCASTALLVLESWFAAFLYISFLTRVIWWAAVISLIVFLYWMPHSIGKILKHFRFLHRQTTTCDFFDPRSLFSIGRRHRQSNRRFVLAPPKEGFIAGGRKWSYAKLTQNVIALGSIGTGKTLCVMNAMLERFIESARTARPMGGLILDYKGDFRHKVLKLCRKHGREKDLVVLSLDADNVWNPLESDEEASEIASRFVASMKALGQKDSNTSFFFQQAECFIENAITLLRLTGEARRPTVFDIHRLANEFEYLSERVEQLPAPSGAIQYDDLQQRCRSYFVSEFYSLPEETRHSVVATINNLLNPICSGKVGKLTQGLSTVNLRDAVENSKIVYLHLPSAVSPKAGKVLGVLMKLAFYGEVKRKQLDDSSQLSFLFADEFQEFFTASEGASDSEFYAVSRQYRHINLIATQNINNFLMKGEKSEAIKSFLSNIKTKIFLQNSDSDTNELASKLFGKYVAELGGDHIGSIAQFVPNVRPEDFVKLKTPERGACDFSESYILNEADHKVDVANRSARWKIHPV